MNGVDRPLDEGLRLILSLGMAPDSKVFINQAINQEQRCYLVVKPSATCLALKIYNLFNPFQNENNSWSAREYDLYLQDGKMSNLSI